MKFILVFSINIIFANVISEWIDLNNHIINSYKLVFNIISCKIYYYNYNKIVERNPPTISSIQFLL